MTLILLCKNWNLFLNTKLLSLLLRFDLYKLFLFLHVDNYYGGVVDISGKISNALDTSGFRKKEIFHENLSLPTSRWYAFSFHYFAGSYSKFMWKNILHQMFSIKR